MTDALQQLNAWVGRGARLKPHFEHSSHTSAILLTQYHLPAEDREEEQRKTNEKMSYDDDASLSLPYEATSNLHEEEQAVQNIWSEININNSWEMLLVQSPGSIMALGRLMVLSLTPSSPTSVTIAEGVSLRERKYELESGYLKTLLVQAVNEGRIAQESAHQSMTAIRHNMNELPGCIKGILELLSQSSSEQIKYQLPLGVNKIRAIIEDSVKEANSLELRFQKAIQMMSARSGSIGRAGFSLLAEVKMFWSAVISFCKELSNLTEYTLGSSCNAFMASTLAQFDVACKQRKYSIKQKAREEVYHTSVAMVAYALSVRHLADAYIRYSNQFIVPQINIIARYPLLATNEIEFAKAQRQFKEYNIACEHETNRITGMSNSFNKRRSILELDMGLNLHINDIGVDLNTFLEPIADFLKAKLVKSISKVKEHNHRQKEKELENEEKMNLKQEEKKKVQEEIIRAQEEKQRAKKEESEQKGEMKRRKAEEERKIKEVNKQMKEEEKEVKQRAKEDKQHERGDKTGSMRMKFWKRSTPSQSPTEPDCLQFDLSLQPSVQHYYSAPQPDLQQSLTSQQSPHSTQSSQLASPSSAVTQSTTVTSTICSELDCSQAQKQSSISLPQGQAPSTPPQSPFPQTPPLSAQSTQSTQFIMSPMEAHPPQSKQRDVKQSQLPEQYFKYPQQVQQTKLFDSARPKQIGSVRFSEVSQFVEDAPPSPSVRSSETTKHFEQTTRTEISMVPPVTQVLHQRDPQQYSANSQPQPEPVAKEDGHPQYPTPIDMTTPLRSAQQYRQKKQPSRRGRPVSYPSNFRHVELFGPEKSADHPLYRSPEVGEELSGPRSEYFSRSPNNPISPQSPFSAQSPYEYNYTSSALSAQSFPSLVQTKDEKRVGFLSRLRASFARKSKKTPVDNHEHGEFYADKPL